MTRQSEHALELGLVRQLLNNGYDFIQLDDESDLIINLKRCIEKHNKILLSDTEFKKIINHLSKGNVFEKAKTLRDKLHITRDDGTSAYIEFLDSVNWCKNYFQVSHQVTMEGVYKNRYDVTLLINGLPLVQVELKRKGLELKEAFNQIQRYHKHSYSAGQGLFGYVQLFVITNGVNTKYYANNKKQNFKQTFYWTDKDNQKITNLSDFADSFLEKCHLSKMICKYIVLAEATKVIMVLRPYQYYATEAIVNQVKTNNKNGYIWHTTGSGKTLTSFKTSQVLMENPDIKKIVFVVDRKDLDYQTTKEFNSFSDGSVDGTDNTSQLVKQFANDTKLIVTTIQKLNNAISSKRYANVMKPLQEEKMVFIFDECHRSQFGETHARINKYFNNNQMFGFTGTPIFVDNAAKNALGKRTTKDLFGNCLHKYVITNAISDGNVLKFAVEYVGKYKDKTNTETYVDLDVEDIDVTEVYNSKERLHKICEYIASNHPRKTHGKTFTGMLCVSSTDNLIEYYEYLRQLKQEGKHNLKVATIFSYQANEEDESATGDILTEEEYSIAADPQAKYIPHKREKLEEYIADYNKMFGTAYSTKDSKSYYNYYNDISKKVRARQIDLLLVVNMFLTGFDSKPLNTLYVDKNLQYHGLIQAYSRTNRILDEKKSHGNIVVFRNLKENTDEALRLFSNVNAKEEIFIPPYDTFIEKFNNAFINLLKITPTVKSVDGLVSELEQVEFVQAFRTIMRIKNEMEPFTDFNWADLSMTEQQFEDYKSKYLDIRDKTKGPTKEKVSILDNIDFELELIQRDEINVDYILRLLSELREEKSVKKFERKKEELLTTLNNNTQLRSKKELIEKFINETLPKIPENMEVEEAFENFWDEEKSNAFLKICTEEQVDAKKLNNIVENHSFTQQPINRDDVINSLATKPKIRERKPIGERIINKLHSFLETFDLVA